MDWRTFVCMWNFVSSFLANEKNSDEESVRALRMRKILMNHSWQLNKHIARITLRSFSPFILFFVWLICRMINCSNDELTVTRLRSIADPIHCGKEWDRHTPINRLSSYFISFRFIFLHHNFKAWIRFQAFAKFKAQ